MIDNGQPRGLVEVGAWRIDSGRARAIGERTADELPFELRINGRSHILLMVHPKDVQYLALGFCLSEGLVDEPGQIGKVDLGRAEINGVGSVVWADVSLPRELARKARVRRVAPAATSCGLCGLESFSQLALDVKAVRGSGFRVEAASLIAIARGMVEHQPVYSATGGTHAACLGTEAGDLIWVMEDVGRHNALDKALGKAVAEKVDLNRVFALLSGRVSYEMALKIARAGIPLVGSVSAPTSLGVRLLDRLGVTLVGYIRDGRATVYTHPGRVTIDGAPTAV